MQRITPYLFSLILALITPLQVDAQESGSTTSRAQDQQERADPEAELGELEREFERLNSEIIRIRARREELQRAVRATRDFGCECESDFCRTERNNEPISQGETDTICHDDVDSGRLGISVVSGTVQVRILRAVWSGYDEYDQKRLEAGQNWLRDIDAASGTFDQTNRVDIQADADSTYNIDFESWD